MNVRILGMFVVILFAVIGITNPSMAIPAVIAVFVFGRLFISAVNKAEAEKKETEEAMEMLQESLRFAEANGLDSKQILAEAIEKVMNK